MKTISSSAPFFLLGSFASGLAHAAIPIAPFNDRSTSSSVQSAGDDIFAINR